MRFFATEPMPNTVWTDVVRSEDYALLRLDGTSRLSGWRPVPVRLQVIDDNGETLQPTDFPVSSSGRLIVNGRATEALGELLLPYGELLPLACVEMPLWIYNPTNLINALDADRTDCFWPDGMVSTPAFRPEAVRGRHVVAIPEFTLSPIFVDETVVRRAKAAGLRGMAFPLVWTDEPDVEVKPLNKLPGKERVNEPWPDLPD